MKNKVYFFSLVLCFCLYMCVQLRQTKSELDSNSTFIRQLEQKIATEEEESLSTSSMLASLPSCSEPPLSAFADPTSLQPADADFAKDESLSVPLLETEDVSDSESLQNLPPVTDLSSSTTSLTDISGINPPPNLESVGPAMESQQAACQLSVASSFPAVNAVAVVSSFPAVNVEPVTESEGEDTDGDDDDVRKGDVTSELALEQTTTTLLVKPVAEPEGESSDELKSSEVLELVPMAVPEEDTVISEPIISMDQSCSPEAEPSSIEVEHSSSNQVEPSSKEIGPSPKEVEPRLNEVEPGPNEVHVEAGSKGVEPSSNEEEPGLNEVEPIPNEVEEPCLNEVEPISNDVEEPCLNEVEASPKEVEPSSNEVEPNSNVRQEIEVMEVDEETVPKPFLTAPLTSAEDKHCREQDNRTELYSISIPVDSDRALADTANPHSYSHLVRSLTLHQPRQLVVEPSSLSLSAMLLIDQTERANDLSKSSPDPIFLAAKREMAWREEAMDECVPIVGEGSSDAAMELPAIVISEEPCHSPQSAPMVTAILHSPTRSDSAPSSPGITTSPASLATNQRSRKKTKKVSSSSKQVEKALLLERVTKRQKEILEMRHGLMSALVHKKAGDGRSVSKVALKKTDPLAKSSVAATLQVAKATAHATKKEKLKPRKEVEEKRSPVKSLQAPTNTGDAGTTPRLSCRQTDKPGKLTLEMLSLLELDRGKEDQFLNNLKVSERTLTP